jgi:hypothetical protein
MVAAADAAASAAAAVAVVPPAGNTRLFSQRFFIKERPWLNTLCRGRFLTFESKSVPSETRIDARGQNSPSVNQLVEGEKEALMEKQTHAVGERVDKLCAICSENRGHIVAAVTKWGRISRVSCPKCGTRSSFKKDPSAVAQAGASATSGVPYDQTQTYRTGQGMVHPTFGPGEVTALVEPQKIDVLFSDRLRRLIHARA